MTLSINVLFYHTLYFSKFMFLCNFPYGSKSLLWNVGFFTMLLKDTYFKFNLSNSNLSQHFSNLGYQTYTSNSIHVEFWDNEVYHANPVISLKGRPSLMKFYWSPFHVALPVCNECIGKMVVPCKKLIFQSLSVSFVFQQLVDRV